MSELTHTLTALAITAVLLSAGLAVLFVRDHVKYCRERNLPILPEWTNLLGIFAVAVFLGACFVSFYKDQKLLCTIVLTGLLFVALYYHNPTKRMQKQSLLLSELGEALRRKLPLPSFLAAWVREHHDAFAARLHMALADFERGLPISVSAGGARLFPAHTLALIQAGEAAGGSALPALLGQQAVELRHEADYRGRLSLARIYPLATSLICLPYAGLIHFHVAPAYLHIERYMQRDGFMGPSLWGTYVSFAQFAVFLVTAFLFAFLFCAYLAVFRGQNPSIDRLLDACREGWTRFTRSLPLVRTRWRHLYLTRIARTLEAQLAAGVPLGDAARRLATQDVAGPYADDLEQLATAVEQGRPLREALAKGSWPPAFAEMLVTGQLASDLPGALAAAAEWHETRLRHWEHALTALTPIFALPITALFVAGTYVPFFLMIHSIQAALRPQ